MGAAFSHLAQKAEDGRIGFGKALGINTLGACLAPLLFGVLLLPLLGSKTTLIALSFGYLALVPLTGRRFYIPAMIPFLGGLSLLFYPGPLRLVTLAPGEKVLAHREGIMAAATVIQDDRGGTHLRINGRFQEGGTTSVYSDRRQGHIPLLLHPHPERVLFLGLGVGATLAAAAEHPGLQAEGVELIPEVISLLPLFHQANGNLDRQSSIRLVQADARRYVQSGPGTYDVIVADLFHPARDGAGSLYTLEHFKALRALLRPGGVFCQWLPLYQLNLNTLRLITRTFLAAFPEGQAFLAHYSLKAPIVGLLARSGTTGYPPDWFQKRLQDPELGPALRRVRLYDEFSLLGTYLAGAGELRAFAGPGALNTDNHPLVTFRAPGFVYETPEPADRRLLQLVRSFSPNPNELLAPPMGGLQPDRNRRLSDYWRARNRFIETGLGVGETDDLRKLLAQVRRPLLEIVRQSRDFEAAYNPLLSMAHGLYRIDPPAGDRLLQELEIANPYRDEARRMRQRLSMVIPGAARPGG
jgi:spermidine synthase